jgi:hypothetical protein
MKNKIIGVGIGLFLTAVVVAANGQSDQVAASAPTATQSPTQIATMTDEFDVITQSYLAVSDDISALMDNAQMVASTGSIQALSMMGTQFTTLGFRGLRLPTFPRGGDIANQSWDTAMQNMIDAGHAMTDGRITAATVYMSQFTTNVDRATAAITSARSGI